MDAIQETIQENTKNPEAMEAFGSRLRGQFTLNESYRRPKELEWLESLRQYKGLYDPDVTIEPNNSKVYPKITRSKVNIVLSRLHEMLFPENDKNWEINPTPEPRISKDVIMQIAMAMVKEDPNTGNAILPTRDELHMAINAYCKKTCEAMSIVIDDQLTEMDYPEETKRVLRSGLMYGTGILKGPMITQRTKRRWEQKPNTREYIEAVSTEDVPYFEFVRIWDWYPDMSTTETDKIDGSFERHVFNKHDMRDLLKRDDFFAEGIRDILERYPNGNYVPKNWEVDLQVIEVEAGSGKATSSPNSSQTDEVNKSTYRLTGKRYEVLEYWGFIDGSDLEACGVNIDDVSLEYGANVWMVENVIIKAVLFEGAVKKYKTFYYEKDETSLFGEGLARVMRHSQIAIAAAARMVLDNGACVAGPQVEVNWSLMSPGQDLSSFYPRKIWYRLGRGVEAQYPAVRALNFDSHVEELIAIVNKFQEFGDQETTLPTWMIGQMVNNETAQATSGRMATITVSIKDVVKNFDTFTEHVLGDLYDWNMEFNPRTDIKGDYSVKPRGVSSLVMKEIRMQALNQLATTMTEEDWLYVNRRDFLQERFKAHDINIALLSEAEVDKKRQDMQNSIQNQLAIKMAEAEIAYKRAQAVAQLTKAKEHNTEAMKSAQEIPAGEDPRLVEADLQKKNAEAAQVDVKTQQMQDKHMQELAHAEDQHQDEKLKTSLDMAHQQEKHQQEMVIKDKQAAHGMKIKEKTAEIKAKQKPAAAKPVKKPKK